MDWKNITLPSFWKKAKDKWIMVFCFGLLLFVLAVPDKKTEEVPESTESPVRENECYEIALEERVRKILEDVEGVGRVDVMVTTMICRENGFGQLGQDLYPEVTGVIISADGGGSSLVRAEISQAMEALFGIPSHKIKVLKRVKKESEK